MNIRKLTITTGMTLVLALTAAACGNSRSSSSVVQSPVVKAQLTQTEQQGLNHLRTCLPNGTAIVNAVLAGKAGVATDMQLVSTFTGANLVQAEKNCLPPGKHPVKQFDKCFKTKNSTAMVLQDVTKAVKPYMAHPILNHHAIYEVTKAVTAQAAVKAAAGCLQAQGLTKATAKS
jgi:hypothetical protein